jgi:hypothetical protein
LRLAFQRSQAILPEKTDALSFFEQTPQVWSLPPEQLRDGLITLGEVLTPALEVVIENHVETADPVVIEGDAILSALISRPTVQTRASHGQIQAVFLVEPEEDTLLAHMDVRYRRSVQYKATELQAMAHVRWLHGAKVASVSYTAKWEAYNVANTPLGRVKDACEMSTYAEERG